MGLEKQETAMKIDVRKRVAESELREAHRMAVTLIVQYPRRK
ncbi:hypothetical protein [Porphyromonas endodontalis]